MAQVNSNLPTVFPHFYLLNTLNIYLSTLGKWSGPGRIQHSSADADRHYAYCAHGPNRLDARGDEGILRVDCGADMCRGQFYSIHCEVVQGRPAAGAGTLLHVSTQGRQK